MEETGSLQLTAARDDAKDASRLDLACPCKLGTIRTTQ